MAKILSKLTGGLRRFADASPYKALPALAVLALILEFVIETLSRRSLIKVLEYIMASPVMFLLNTLIILFTLSAVLLFRRRTTALLFITVLWLALGIANFFVLSYRSSPLSAIDFLILKAAMGMTSLYFSVFQIVLIIVVALLFIAAMVYMFIKSRRSSVSYGKAALSVALCGICTFALSFAVSKAGTPEYRLGDLADAYDKLGFAYCFSQGLLSQGVERPTDYTLDDVYNVIGRGDSDTQPPQTDTAPDTSAPDTNAPPHSEKDPVSPNIIIVQLESFFDITQLKNVHCETDPTPNFTRLKNEGISGYLHVPHVGGGTANVEFEVLTGMNLDHFGFGEYPYTTVLKSNACESIANNMKAMGYTSHAMHNHIATFYDRNKVYASLGFDTFTPIEMMAIPERNPLGWAKDTVLTGEIISAVSSTESRDVVFAVSVQGHGKYPEKPVDITSIQTDGYSGTDKSDIPDIKFTVESEDDSVYPQYAYYISQLYEMDMFIGELISALDALDEPCIAVFYGDHLPALPFEEKDLVNPDMYETEYAVWTNFNVTEDDVNSLDCDLEAYRLSAYILSLIGVSEGDINALHQQEFATGKDYTDMLRVLEYTQLYSDDKIEYTPADMTFGTRPFNITAVTFSGNRIRVIGEGFNEYTRIKVNGIKKKTEFINENTLEFESIFSVNVDDIEVVQMTDDGVELASATKKDLQ